MTNNKDLNYIAECTESVGIHVDEHTAISIPFIADVMQKMREQSNSDEDCISRKVVLSLPRKTHSFIYGEDYESIDVKLIEELPSVQPKPKTGHWIHREVGIYRYASCSECGKLQVDESNYCPNCGVRMEEYGENDKYTG